MNNDHWAKYNGGLKPTTEFADAKFAAAKGMDALREKGLFLSGKATHEYKRIIESKRK